MFYFLSSSTSITKNNLSKFNFKKDDTIIIFNRKNDHTIGLILNYLDKKYKFKIKVIWCQRETLCEPLYRGSRSPHVKNPRFNTFYLIGGGSLKKDRSKKTWKYNDKMIEFMKDDFNTYSKILLNIDNNRKIYHIKFKDMVYPYGSGYELFDIKNYEPYTGLLMIIYFDRLFPNESKTMIGFNCYQNRGKKKKILIPGHRDLLDYNILKSYCINRKIDFRYSKLSNGIMIDDNSEEYIPLFKLNGLIDIENPNSDIIIKCENYDERVNHYINSCN